MQNYIKRHWYGQQSLAKSFWVNYVVVSLALVALYGLAIMLGYLSADIRITCQVYTISSILLIIVSYILFPWQTVGVWRSSQGYIKQNRKQFWPRLTQLIVIVGLIYTAYSIPTDYPKLSQFFQISYKLGFTDALDIDPIFSKNSPLNYELKLENAGKTLYITGVFKPGIAKDVEKMIQENPNLETIILNSPGGRLSEGKTLADMISKNELNTATTQGCYSACTDVFIAGKKRTINNNAKLGFHKATISGEELNELVFEEIFKKDAQTRFFPLCRKQGINEAFIDAYKEKVLNSSGNVMWYPTLEELLQMQLVHEAIDADHKSET